MLSLFDAAGLLSFSFSGAAKGVSKNLDLFGISLLGVLTALGGGAARDMLVNRIPLMLTNPWYPAFSLAGTAAAILVGRRGAVIERNLPFLLSDAIGLAAFTSAGCSVAAEHGLGLVGIAGLGLITAIGGGILRDLLAMDIPLVLRSEVYASCSLAGGIVFWGLVSAGVPGAAPATCTAVVFILRLFAIAFRWKLPRFTENGLSGKGPGVPHSGPR